MDVHYELQTYGAVNALYISRLLHVMITSTLDFLTASLILIIPILYLHLHQSIFLAYNNKLTSMTTYCDIDYDLALFYLLTH